MIPPYFLLLVGLPMWVFLSGSMLSIVQHRDHSQVLMVRARLRGDIERVFPDHDVVETPDADYRFRATVRRDVVAEAIKAQVMAISYPNFKGSVQESERHDAYMDVWGVMLRAQEDGVAASAPRTRSLPPRSSRR